MIQLDRAYAANISDVADAIVKIQAPLTDRRLFDLRGYQMRSKIRCEVPGVGRCNNSSGFSL